MKYEENEQKLSGRRIHYMNKRILIHGAVGVTPDAVAEMLCTLFLIYGMLIVRKATGNAWGCVLIFVLYWNAL